MTDTTQKPCLICGEVKPLNAFTAQTHGYLGCHSRCKSCRARLARAEYAVNPERQKLWTKRSRLKRLAQVSV